MLAPAKRIAAPSPGFGLGLRPDHYADVLGGPQPVDWFEVISENFFGAGGKPISVLERVRARLSDRAARRVAVDRFGRRARSSLSRPAGGTGRSHRSAVGVGPSLLDRAGRRQTAMTCCPCPIRRCARPRGRHIGRCRDRLKRRILIENPSSYVAFAESEMDECDFLSAMAERADCLLLADVNNIYVSARNHDFDARAYMAALPAARIQQIHLAGHSDAGDMLIDTHDSAVCDPVWDLYAESRGLWGDVATMIERDDHIPPLADLLTELDRARTLAAIDG